MGSLWETGTLLLEVSAHILVVSLVGTTADLEELGISPESLNVVRANVTITTKSLDSAIGNSLGDWSSEELDTIGIEGVTVRGEIEVVSDVVDVGSGSLVFAVGLSDLLLDLTVFNDGLAEGLSLLTILDHDLDGSSGDTEGHGSKGKSLDLEVSHHAEGSLTELTDDVLLRNLDVLKDELSGHGGSHTELVLDLLAEGEAWGVLLDNEGSETTGLLVVLVGLGIDKEDITSGLTVDGTVGDPHLVTREGVVVTGGSGEGTHTEDISAVAWLGHTHTAVVVTGTGKREVLLLLGLGAILVKVVNEENGVGEVRKTEGWVRGRELLYRKRKKMRLERNDEEVKVTYREQ